MNFNIDSDSIENIAITIVAHCFAFAATCTVLPVYLVRKGWRYYTRSERR